MVCLTVDGRYPEHYHQQYPADSGPSRQRGRVPDPYYRTAIDPYVTLTPSERAKIRQTDSGALSHKLLSLFHLQSQSNIYMFILVSAPSCSGLSDLYHYS